ncbi:MULTISPECIES: bifunctional diguanylate cyclase/phosphodiesterase [Bradyrhizobium]|uniref:bifunctional diguanylate cyclase/phosphodiesterase n=1 Tax=Bradyrhizobium TaxID=374 RepID=UPI001BAD76BF|nr:MULTISPECIES: EAL domain-containing protein [Bradyrhizobium]MBR0931381.1 EAL domain-containing protein [Bradyrhizobium diazoefficiens]MCS3759881.1 diguanylate cyclase (GGDEF)-like protein [Bradyrhizobium centrosematis]MCS3772230.1 diguanylate cyclase (GGDEF)-like protein [Bradyrhizobium centrosematis]MDT4737647.1 EAL domain-containing protein [Bradyrhizobium sp. WYCCWR 12699]
MMTRFGSRLFDQAFVRSGPIRWLVVGGTLLIAAIAVGSVLMAQNFRERALRNAGRELENTVLLLAHHFDQQLQDFAVIQRDFVDHARTIGIASVADFRTRLSGQGVHQMLRSKIDALPYIGGVNIIDADGNLINSSTAWPVPKVNMADRAYFRTFKYDPNSPEVLIEPLHSRISGAWTVLIVRKIVGPNGEFLGVVGRGIEPANFEKFFATVALGESATISMLHRDGTLLARYPHSGELMGRNFKTGSFEQQRVFGLDHFAGRFTSPIDGEDRLISSRALPHFPILMMATTTRAAALSDWREQIGMLISVAAASALAIAGVLIAVVRKLLEQHRASRERLTLEKQRLDRAVNNMTQGLLLFDAERRLVVCNQRYIEMYGLSAEIVKPGCSFHDIIAHRKATGSFTGDVDRYVVRVLKGIHARNSMVVDTSDGRSIHILNEPLADGGWVATHEDITERRRIEERITHLAHYDALTDLPNRTMFHEHLREELAALGNGEEIAVHYIDIDEFKGVNDALGHLVGDELLKSVATSLRRCAGPADFVARLGGDEFAIVQSAVTSRDQVDELVARVFAAIRAPFDCMGHHLTTDASIGIALAPEHGTALDQILKNADMAMYAAKSAGRRTYRFFEPEMDAKVRERRQLESDLRHAIAEGGLEVYYQPCLSLKDDRITGCEALVRWRHPERGMVSPAEFIPIAEDTGLINEIGEWVLATACRDAANWPDDIRLAVNVSPVQFKSGTLALKIMAALAASNLPASRLELEITEAVLIRDDDAALTILHQLRAIGVRIALDDFGTGYSSLSYLHRFPFDKIKIDRCFVDDIAGPDGSASIVQAVVNLAAARRMTTTAEGVETEEQQRLLRALGCSEMQGYLFSAAKPADKVLELFALHRSRLARREGNGGRRREAG